MTHPMTNPYDSDATDYQLAAEQARAAIAAGRLDLGYEFLRVALRIRHYERLNGPAERVMHDQHDQHLPIHDQASTALMRAVDAAGSGPVPRPYASDAEPTAVHTTAKCVAQIHTQAVDGSVLTGTCERPVWFHRDSGAWWHIDPAHNDHHRVEVPLEVMETVLAAHSVDEQLGRGEH